MLLVALGLLPMENISARLSYYCAKGGPKWPGFIRDERSD